MGISHDLNYQEGQVLLFDKPKYWTSFDLVKKVKNIIGKSTGLKKLKVGHAGTLDPLATGLMIICTGKATKEITRMQALDKEYIARFFAGSTTPSFDMETEVDRVFGTENITREGVEKVLESFLGEQEQVPPLFSAKNIGGKRAYEYARKGIEKKLDPVPITFYALELLDYSMPTLTVRIRCSKGTYIRSLARDLGEALGCGAYLSELKRTAIGDYLIEDAISIKEFELLLFSM